ncbi:MAG TPA: C4-dicarboxylate ABC transporter [Firmicutes bacterium]|jgi:tripartite ATP-independent transporter DctP family solute receptor|nr:C4-dicarboxylate ABC transporter [Bacillota bacterium]
MSKKCIVLVIAVLFLISVGAGFAAPATQGAPAPKPTGNQIVLRLSNLASEGYPTIIGARAFAQIVEKETKGRVKVMVYPNAVLGQEKAVMEQLQFGAIDFAILNGGLVSTVMDQLNVFQLPYIFKSYAQAWKVFDGPIGSNILASIDKSQNLEALGYYDSGSRCFYTKKPVKSLADLKGLKIRVVQSALFMDMAKNLEFSATPMDVGEIYSGLQTGVIDGAENSMLFYVSNNHDEVAKYFLEDNHMRLPDVFLASAATMNKLSVKDRNIIRMAVKESEKVDRAAWINQEKTAKAKALAAGCTVTTLDSKGIAAFQKATVPMYNEVSQKYGSIIKKIQNTK